MSEQAPPPVQQSEPGTVPARISLSQRAGGVVTPLVTTIVAFLIGGLVVLVLSGKNPLFTYKEIFNGTGLTWLFPWDTTCSIRDPGNELCTTAGNLQQTLIALTVLVLTGLAVAFAFRCGLFNIGGQGQYIVGAVVGFQVGLWFDSMPAAPHILLAFVAAGLAGAFWAGIAGFLKATVGAHEVITTIMLNWIAYWVATYLVNGGPLQDPVAEESGAAVSRASRVPRHWS